MVKYSSSLFVGEVYHVEIRINIDSFSSAHTAFLSNDIVFFLENSLIAAIDRNLIVISKMFSLAIIALLLVEETDFDEIRIKVDENIAKLYPVKCEYLL